MKTFFGVEAQDAIGSHCQVKIAAVKVGINLTAELVRDEKPILFIDRVFIFTC